MELNREQIIKALECCAYDNGSCGDCPYGRMPTLNNCVAFNLANAYQLVKKLTEENERLTEELAKSYKSLDEQMNFYCSFTKSKIQNCPINDEIAKAKADTVRKMQERLTKEFDRLHKNNFMTVEVRQWIIDQIAKEMVEGV